MLEDYDIVCPSLGLLLQLAAETFQILPHVFLKYYFYYPYYMQIYNKTTLEAELPVWVLSQSQP